MSGQKNVVYTGVAIKYGKHIEKFTESSEVFFADLTNEQIQAYVDTEEPLWVVIVNFHKCFVKQK